MVRWALAITAHRLATHALSGMRNTSTAGSEGYAIVATDYQGLGTPGPHAYLNSRAAAYATLDSLRAALGDKTLALSEKSSSSVNPKVRLPRSHGSFASDAELKILGTVVRVHRTLADPAKMARCNTAPIRPSRSAWILQLPTSSISPLLRTRLNPPACRAGADRQGVTRPAGRRTTCVQPMFEGGEKRQLNWINTFKTDFMRYYAQPFSKGAVSFLENFNTSILWHWWCRQGCSTRFQPRLSRAKLRGRHSGRSPYLLTWIIRKQSTAPSRTRAFCPQTRLRGKSDR